MYKYYSKINIFLYLQASVHRTNVRVYPKRLPTFFSWKRSENRREKSNFYTVTEANERTAHFSSPNAPNFFSVKTSNVKKAPQYWMSLWSLDSESYKGAEKKDLRRKKFLTLVLQSR